MKTYDEELVKDRVNRFPFVKLMGMKLLSCSGGKSVIRCRVREGLKNSGGTLHGGPERGGGPGRFRFRHVLHPQRAVARGVSGYNGGDDGPVEAGPQRGE